MARLIGFFAALIAGFVIFYTGAVTPPPAPVNAPAADFSAARAFADVQVIGAVSHALGSPANAKVRDYLMARMQTLGLSPQIQRGVAIEARGTTIAGGQVENVIGVLPGRDHAAPALAIMAHHDSVYGSPGAADDTAGVASALEIVRALKTHGTPARDVMVVITDGEEMGLLGARAFFDSPLAAHVGYVINMETRGGGGKAVMFETANQNGADIALYRHTAKTPDSDALTVYVYQHLPNDTDFTVAKQHGKVGLNYAFIGRQFDYHSPSSTPAALDIGSLQHMGQQVLPTAVALAFGALPGRAPDRVYGNLPFGLTAAYPMAAGWLVLLGCGGLVGFGVVRARRDDGFAWIDLARGVGAALYLIAFAGAALMLVRAGTGVGSGWMGYRPLLARFPTFEVMMLAASLGALALTAAFAGRSKSRWVAAALPLLCGLGACLFGGWTPVALGFGVAGGLLGVVSFGRPARTIGTWAGVLLLGLIAGVALQVLAPLAAYVIAWPLLAGAVAFALGGSRRALVAQVVIAALTVAWVGLLLHSLMQGLDMPLLEVLPTLLAAFVLWPLASADAPGDARLWIGGAFLVVGAVLAGFLHFTSPWTPRHPNSVEPVFVIDPAAHKSWRASLTTSDAWTRQMLTAEGGAIGKQAFAFTADPVDAAAAAYVDAPAPDVTRTNGADGTVTLTVRPHPGDSELLLRFRAPDAVTDVRVDGQPAIEQRRGQTAHPVSLKPNQWGGLAWVGTAPLTVSFQTTQPAKAEISVTVAYDRWMSAKALPPTPAADQMWSQAGSTYVVSAVAP